MSDNEYSVNSRWKLLGLAAALLAAAGAAYELVGGWIDSRRFPPRGRMVAAGLLELHVDDRGAGAPTVILEAGIAATSLSWCLVQPEIAGFARSVSYDRAGLGWSSRCQAPRTLSAMLSEFDSMLAAAAIPPPYILVGHSFGALLIRAWASGHPDKVAGMVMVDPVSLDYWGSCSRHERTRLALAAMLARQGRRLSRFGIVRGTLTMLLHGGNTPSKIIGYATAGPAMSVLKQLATEIGKLPPDTWPIIRSHWSCAKCLEALGAYLECLPQAAAEALRRPTPRGIPLTILSAANATPAELEERESWIEASGRGRHEIIPGTDHWIPFERPDVVVKAVEELVELAQRNARQEPGQG